MNSRLCKWLVSFVVLFCLTLVTSSVVAKKKVKPPPEPVPPPEYQVVFEEMYRGGATDLVAVNSDGSDRRAILEAAQYEKYTQAQFSPDGSKIVFARGDKDRVSNGIYTINTDGTDFKLVAKLRGGIGSGWKTHAPVFSRTLINGQEMILFSDAPYDDPFGADLFVVPADGFADPLNITNSPDNLEINAVWSDDGTFIIAAETGRDIYRHELDLAAMLVTSTTNITADTDLSGLSRNLSMAKGAGDNRICVVSLDDILYIMETDGASSPQPIITDPLLISAAFLPDGSGFVVDTSTEIYLIDINGDFIQMVTTKTKKAQSIRLPDIRSISANTE
jgi:hypothetical protein